MIKKKEIVLNSSKELFDIAELDYKNLSIGFVDNMSFVNFFELPPNAYLSFAKIDLKQKDDRGLINALSNSKRAIDCLIENTLKNFSINIKKIPKVALSFCDDVLGDENKNINPISLRLFCALGLSPSLLVAEVRELRNKIEHEFNIPEKKDVLRAYEVAELLINNIKAKEIYSCKIDISDIHKHGDLSYDHFSGIVFQAPFRLSTEEIGDFRLEFINENRDEYSYTFNQEDKEYYYFLKAMFVAEFDSDELMTCIGEIISSDIR